MRAAAAALFKRPTFRPALPAHFSTGLDNLPTDPRPRDLRGSFASLLIAEGQSVLEVTRQLGHSPATCLRDYAALFDDFDPAVRVDPEGEVRRARRAARCSPSYSLGTQVGA